MLNEFYINGTWEENIEGCYQFSSMGWVLASPQHFRSQIPLSRWCKKPNKKGTQRELTSKRMEKYDNDGGSKSDQKYRSRVILGNKR